MPRRFWPVLASLAIVLFAAQDSLGGGGDDLFAKGVTLRAEGNSEAAIQQFWQASQAGHPRGMEHMQQCYTDLGRTWAFFHDLARVALRQLMQGESGAAKVRLQTQLRDFFESSLAAGAPPEVVQEWKTVRESVLGELPSRALGEGAPPKKGRRAPDRRTVPEDDAEPHALQGRQADGQADGAHGAGTWHRLGMELFGKRQWGAALDAITEATRLDPTNVQAASQVGPPIQRNKKKPPFCFF